jgi:PadR family transcriptional regulator, regulatory protein PadR
MLPMFKNLLTSNVLDTRSGRNKNITLGDFEYMVLLAVQAKGKDAFGAEIGRHLTESMRKPMAMAQVYVTLSRLEKKGFLAAENTPSEPVQGGRRKRLYRLEASGVRALKEKTAAINAVADGMIFAT